MTTKDFSRARLEAGAVGEQLASLHATVRGEFSDLDRMAIALYDPATDVLRTFVHSTDGDTPLRLYEAKLETVPSLAQHARTRETRVLDDLATLIGSPAEHSRKILERGYRSSYTVPFYDNDTLRGFLFYDSRTQGYFTPAVLGRLGLVSELVVLLIRQAMVPVKVLRAATSLAKEVSYVHDDETGAHLERMSRYARALAQILAEGRGLSDEWVEFVALFAPVHDIGKLGVPDRVLLKTDRLTGEETEVMRAHVLKGVEIVDSIVREFGVGALPHVDMLRNIVLYHHELADGTGYPHGLKASETPLEARIVAVADIFDALTSERSYKPAWSNDDAYLFFQQWAGVKFDQACVDALMASHERIVEIQQRFADPPPTALTQA